MSSGEDAAVASDAPAASDASPKDPNANIYENRPKKIIRVVTVMAYLFSVSFAAILLSTYYIFLWEPPNPRLIERERLRADPEMQFLFADAPSSSGKKGDLELGRREYKSFQGRVVDYDDGSDERQAKLNTMLMKLRYSLVEIMRAQNGSRSLEPAISDDLFVTVEEALNSTKRLSRGKDLTSKYENKNISGEKTDRSDSSPRFENSTNVEKYARNRTSRLSLPANVDNFQQNHSFGMSYSNNNNKNNDPSSDQTERIVARGGISIVESSSPRDSKFANDPGFHRSPDDPPVAGKPWLYTTRNSEETQIERMTAKSTIMDNKQPESANLLTTTQRQKDLQEIPTETTDVEETSVRLTSVSTVRDYRGNFTSVANDDGDVT